MKKLTKRESRLLEKLRSGAVLCVEHGLDERYRQGRRWFVEPGGSPVDYKVADRLVARDGILRPLNDGLFGASQSYGVA